MNRLFTMHTLFYGLIFLVLVISMTAMISFFDLGGAVDRILQENMRSVEAAERMDSAVANFLLSLSAGNSRSGMSLSNEWERTEHDFLAAYHDAQDNLTLTGEREIVEKIHQSYRDWSSSITEITGNSVPDNEENWKLFATRTRILRNEIDKLSVINRNAMTNASERAKKMARERSLWMILLTIIGFFSAYYTHNFIQRSISAPMREINRILRRVNMNHFDMKIRRQEGEFEILSEQLNGLIEKLSDSRSEVVGIRSQYRNLSSALIESFGGPILVFDLRQELVLASRQARPLIFGAEGQEILSHIAQALVPSEQSAGTAATTTKTAGDSWAVKRFCTGGSEYQFSVLGLENENFQPQGFLVRIRTNSDSRS